MSVELHFLGAARTVTGSKHLLVVNERRILLECGLYQGRRETAHKVNREMPVDPDTLDGFERRLLKEAFRQAANLQDRIRSDYQL